jgi:hypothetical protein
MVLFFLLYSLSVLVGYTVRGRPFPRLPSGPCTVSHPWIEELHFSVELHQPGGSVEEVVARCAGILIAQAAFKAACTH